MALATLPTINAAEEKKEGLNPDLKIGAIQMRYFESDDRRYERAIK